MLDLIRSVLAVCAIALAALGIGRPLLRMLRITPPDRGADVVWGLALGLIAGACVLSGLARVDGLHPLVVLSLTLAATVWSTVEIACLVTPWVVAWRLGDRPRWRGERHDGPVIVGLGLVAVVLLLGAVRAVVPPVSTTDGVSKPGVTALAVGKLLLHGGPEAADEPAPNAGPVEVWAAWALALEGPVAAQLLFWLIGVLLVAATWLLASTILGSRHAVLALAALLLIPAVQQQLGSVGPALPLALYGTLALVAVQRMWLQCESGYYDVLAGGMAAAAAVVDRGGLLLAVAIVAVAGWLTLRPQREIRNWLPWMRLAGVTAIGLVAGLVFGSRTNEGLPDAGVWGQLGPLVLIGCGGWLFARRLRGLPWLMATLGIYLILSLAIGGSAATWAPLVSGGAVLVAWVGSETRRLPVGPRWGLVMLTLVVAVAELLVCCRSAGPGWQLASGRVSRETYLLAHDASYRAARLLNGIDSQATVALAGTGDLYLVGHTLRLDETAQGAGDTAELCRLARQRGARYLLLAEEVADDESPGQGVFDAVVLAGSGAKNLTQSGEVIPILEYRFADDNNRCSRYRLWKLQGLPAFSTVEPVARLSEADRVEPARPATR